MARALQTRGAGFGLVVVALVLFVALSADVIAPYNPDQAQQAGVLTAPALAHWLGTDQLGRDVLSRIIHGARTSVQAGVVSVGFALIAGVSIGLLAGYVAPRYFGQIGKSEVNAARAQLDALLAEVRGVSNEADLRLDLMCLLQDGSEYLQGLATALREKTLVVK